MFFSRWSHSTGFWFLLLGLPLAARENRHFAPLRSLPAGSPRALFAATQASAVAGALLLVSLMLCVLRVGPLNGRCLNHVEGCLNPGHCHHGGEHENRDHRQPCYDWSCWAHRCWVAESQRLLGLGEPGSQVLLL